MTRKLARVFPATHPKKGQPTHFVEKFLMAMKVGYGFTEYFHTLIKLNPDKDEAMLREFWLSLDELVANNPKLHTIRLKNSIKDGQMLQLSAGGNDINEKSGRSGPYQSKSINIWEPVQVGVQDVYADSGQIILKSRAVQLNLNVVALGDGLLREDFDSWFLKASGPAQIIHWTELRY